MPAKETSAFKCWHQASGVSETWRSNVLRQVSKKGFGISGASLPKYRILLSYP